MSDTISRLYKKWEELKSESKKDCQPVNHDTMNKDFQLAELSMKWLGYFQDWKRALILMETKQQRMKRELTEFYRGGGINLRLETKDEINLFIETDERYCLIFEQSKIIKSILKFCEDVMEKLRMRSFEVKNWIEWTKFQAGER